MRVSYSQFTTWANCPMGWKLKYVDGLSYRDDSIDSIFGTAVHEIVQEWLDILYNQSETVAKTVYLNDKFKERLLELFKNCTTEVDGQKMFLCDKDTLVQYYNQGCEIISYIQQNYKKLFPTEDTKLFAIEYPISLEIRNGISYLGYIDVVTHNTKLDSYVLYDLKTSKRGWSDYQKSDPYKTGQLLLYKQLFAKQENVDINNINIEYHILKRLLPETQLFSIPRVTKFIPPHKSPSLKKNWVLFESFLNGAFDSDGKYITEQKATPSKSSCMFCVFKDKKDICEYGVT